MNLKGEINICYAIFVEILFFSFYESNMETTYEEVIMAHGGGP